MLVEKWHGKLEEVLLDGARWPKPHSAPRIQLASSPICQNALQLADDMYVEVIYLSIFL